MQKTKTLVLTALFAAMACIATIVIRIPTPGTGGYIHLGDSIVILCGIFLNPAAAFLASGLGSCMADLLGGYFIYVPITFFVKGLTALAGSYLFRSLAGKSTSPYIAVAACGLIDILLVTGGYGICEVFLYSFGPALANVPANILQGISGLVISSFLYPLLNAIPDVKQLANRQDK